MLTCTAMSAMSPKITLNASPANAQESTNVQSTRVAIPHWLDLAMAEHQRSHCGSEFYRDGIREELAASKG